MPGWDQVPLRRLVLVEGYVAGIVSAESGHVVGLNSRGYLFCSRFGNMFTARDIPEAAGLVLGRVGRVWQVWYILLPRQEVISTQPWCIGVPLVALAGGGAAFVESYLYGAVGLETASHPGPRLRGLCLTCG